VKNGICPLCGSHEVYKNEKFNTLSARGDELHFQAETDKATAIFRFDTYVCTGCGFTAMFAKSDKGLAFLHAAGDWSKVA